MYLKDRETNGESDGEENFPLLARSPNVQEWTRLKPGPQNPMWVSQVWLQGPRT